MLILILSISAAAVDGLSKIAFIDQIGVVDTVKPRCHRPVCIQKMFKIHLTRLANPSNICTFLKSERIRPDFTAILKAARN